MQTKDAVLAPDSTYAARALEGAQREVRAPEPELREEPVLEPEYEPAPCAWPADSVLIPARVEFEPDEFPQVVRAPAACALPAAAGLQIDCHPRSARTAKVAAQVPCQRS